MTTTPPRTPGSAQARTEELLALSSVPPDDKGCQRRLAGLLAPLGFRCESVQSGDVTNLWARRGDAQPLVVFAGHTDVVPAGPLRCRGRGAGAPPSPTGTGRFRQGSHHLGRAQQGTAPRRSPLDWGRGA